MLRLGRSLSSKTNPPDGSASATLQYRLDQALAARNEAEEALALSRVEKKELQARVVELEGGPAARDLAATKRALESAKAQLLATQETAAHERDVLRDEVEERSRGAGQLEFQLRNMERMAKEHEANAKRSATELEAARQALADERKARYLAEDQLRAAESRGAGEAASRAHQAELQLIQMAEEAKAREAELGMLRGQLSAATAERDDLRRQMSELAASSTEQETALAEMKAALGLVREALGAEAAEDVSDPTGVAGDAPHSSRASVQSISGLVRALKQQAMHGEALEASAAAADAAATEARRQADSSAQRAAAVEAELASVQRALQASESAREEMSREEVTPVLSLESVVQERDARLFELTSHVVPTLEQQAADAQAALARVEARLDVEKEAKAEARAQAATATEGMRTAKDRMELAVEASAAAERLRAAAEEKAHALNERCRALESEVEAWRRKESAYHVRESEVAEKVGTSDVRASMLEEQARLMTIALAEEEAKLAARDEMLRSLQQELASSRRRAMELEQRCALAAHSEQRSQSAKRHAETERDELQEKLSYAMMEVNARAERLEHSQAQVAASRGEILSLENQLAIASNQLSMTQQENAALAQADSAKGAQLASALGALKGREARLAAAERAALEAREESAARRAELTELGEKLGVANEERALFEQQLTAARQRGELLQVEVEMARSAARSAEAEARDEQMIRVAHESRAVPLREALHQRELDVEEAEERNAGRVLLVEKLHTAEAMRVSESEKAAGAARKAAASELKAQHAEERLEMVRSELSRREGKLAELQAALAASEEELAIMRASKDLLAARVQLQEELARQRQTAANEEIALQSALTTLKDKHLEATDMLVRAAGKHAAESLSAVRESHAQRAEAEREAEGAWEGKIDKAERSMAKGEAQLSELHGRLMAARLEVEASSARAETLGASLASANRVAEEKAAELEQTRDQAFHNVATLAKLLLNTKRRPENVLVQELYDEIQAKDVPVSEWPNWIMMRMSGGEPLSKWL